MQIVELKDDDKDRLRKAIQREKGAVQRDRLRAVLMALDGMDAPSIAEKIGRSRRFVQQWVYAYRDGDLEGIRPKPRPGRACQLNADQRWQLAERLRAGPADGDGTSAFTGRDVVDIIRSTWGKTYSLSGAYELMHRLGFKPLVPRPRHPGHDPKKAKEFERRRAPLL